MLSLVFNCLLVFCLSLASSVYAQSAASAASTGAGYVGYNVSLEGDTDSVVFSTEETRPYANLTEPDPDIFLNASVFVGEISLDVENLTAKVNLDLQILQLLTFNAGVDVSIDRVNLLIQNVTAKVLLEARLQNLVLMVNDTLSSIDLNPVIASLGNDVSSVVNNTAGALGSTVGGVVGGVTGSSGSTSVKRNLNLDQNILFSVNDYSGNTHTQRILAQNGDIVEQEFDNNAQVHSRRVVGSYAKDMTYNGHEESMARAGELVQQLQYTYAPIHGVSIVAAIYINEAKAVVATEVLSEFDVGGGSTISDL